MNEFGFNQMAWLFGGQEVDLSSAERAIDQLSQDRDAAQVGGVRLGLHQIIPRTGVRLSSPPSRPLAWIPLPHAPNVDGMCVRR